jgi:hypothetical protein
VKKNVFPEKYDEIRRLDGIVHLLSEKYYRIAGKIYVLRKRQFKVILPEYTFSGIFGSTHLGHCRCIKILASIIHGHSGKTEYLFLR